MQTTGLAEQLHAVNRSINPAPSFLRRRAANDAVASTEEPVRKPASGRRSTAEPGWLQSARRLRELSVAWEDNSGVLWTSMMPERRPSSTPSLLANVDGLLDCVERAWEEAGDGEAPIRYLVVSSRVPGIFNLGGDLPLFLDLISAGDGEGLRRYAHACIEIQHRLVINLDLPLTTIALVQGDALGGGFEGALAHEVIIAERQARFGLPEVLFNMFPGMGAYSMLSRRLGPVQAKRMILSGRVFTAEEMHAMGVVDVLAEDGAGETAVRAYIADAERSARARRALFKAARMVDPITRGELLDITDLWVEAALTLDDSDLRKMRHLAKAQDRRWARIKEAGF
ncbi:MAG: enoyl-CoA hydratase [Rhodospirillales bacterium]|nr:MAG: enoyl-CoA hydratase [Rhodospirillales bacterium]